MRRTAWGLVGAAAIALVGCGNGGEGFDDEAVRAALSDNGFELDRDEAAAEAVVDTYRELCSGEVSGVYFFLKKYVEEGWDIEPPVAALRAGCPGLLDEAIEQLRV